MFICCISAFKSLTHKNQRYLNCMKNSRKEKKLDRLESKPQSGFVSWLMLVLVPLMMSFMALGVDVASLYSSNSSLKSSLAYAGQVAMQYYSNPANLSTAVQSALASNGVTFDSATTGLWCQSGTAGTKGTFSPSVNGIQTPCPGSSSGSLPAVQILAHKTSRVSFFSLILPNTVYAQLTMQGGSANVALIGADTCPLAIDQKMYYGSSEDGTSDHFWSTKLSRPSSDSVFEIGYNRDDNAGDAGAGKYSTGTGWIHNWETTKTWSNDNNNPGALPGKNLTDVAVGDTLRVQSDDSVRSTYLGAYVNKRPACKTPGANGCAVYDEPVNTHYYDFFINRMQGGTTNCRVPIIDSNKRVIAHSAVKMKYVCPGYAEYHYKTENYLPDGVTPITQDRWFAYTDSRHVTLDANCDYGVDKTRLRPYVKAKLGNRDDSDNYQHEWPAKYSGSNTAHKNYGENSAVSIADR